MGNGVWITRDNLFFADFYATTREHILLPVGNVLHVIQPESVCVSMFVFLCRGCYMQISLRDYDNPENIVHNEHVQYDNEV